MLTVDLFLMLRDGRSHCDGRSNPERSAEWTQRRRDAAGDGQVPFCVFGQGLPLVIISCNIAQCIDFYCGRKSLPEKVYDRKQGRS